MKRNSIGPMIGAATAALVMVGCATTRSAQDAPATRSETSQRGPGVNEVQPTGTKVKRNILTSTAPYTGMVPGTRITYDPPERGEPETPDSPK